MDVREGLPAVCNHRPTGDDTMQMATTLRRSTHTFLTHLFGPGLDDDRYLVERFQSKADGEIRPRRRNGASKKGRGKASSEIVSLSTVQRMRPERDEIIICTGVNSCDSIKLSAARVAASIGADILPARSFPYPEIAPPPCREGRSLQISCGKLQS